MSGPFAIHTSANRTAQAKMRFLDFADMVVLLPATERAVETAAAKLHRLFDRCNGDKERIARLFEQGTLKHAEVQLKGETVSVFWYRVEDGKLIVDTLISVDNRTEVLEASLEAMKRLAYGKGCNCLEGTTARAGMAEALQAMDWYPTGVTLRKDI